MTAPTAPIESILVVVPACNEEALIDDCLTSVDQAAGHVRRARPAITVETLVVLDACDDATAERVCAHPGVGAITCQLRCVGAARSFGIAHALRSMGRPERLWIANTDADSWVPPHWLVRMLLLAARGADVVVGTVLPDDLPVAVRDRWLGRHVLAEDHPHIHGANLGVRASTYLELGGFAAAPVGEDVDLVRRAELAGVEIVRTATLPVTTSSRRVGRAAGGFGSYIDAVFREGEAG